MVRQSSSQAYQELVESGKQRTQCEVILDYIEKGGRVYTLQELCQYLKLGINAISGRVNDLKKAGKLVEYSKRKCMITGRTVTPVGLPTEQVEMF